MVLPEPTSSWTYVLDHLRVPSDQSPGEIAAAQLAALVPQLTVRPLLVGDRDYGSARFVQRTAQVA